MPLDSPIFRPTSDRVSFMLGLPYLAENELLAAARRLNAPVLLSANALSRWRRDDKGIPIWCGFNQQSLRHMTGLKIALDSAGFVAAAKYRRYPWSIDAYMDLCAAADWLWFASMDMCVEPEVAATEEVVLNRISGTVRLNQACANEAARRGISDRLMPVIQGWRPDHYLRCIDRMGCLVEGRAIIGIGSMCRRHVNGHVGVIQVLDTLDRAFGSNPVRFHLFGLKSSALELISSHPRVASADSQAYGVKARRAAIQRREAQPDFSKSNAFTAKVMEDWYRDQVERLRGVPRPFPVPTGMLPLEQPGALHPIEARVQAAAEDLRRLHEDGEVDFGDLNPQLAYEWAYMDDGKEPEIEE